MVIEGQHLEDFRMMCAITELSLRTKHGASSTRINLVKFCKEEYGTVGKSNRAVLREMLALWEIGMGEKFPIDKCYENAYPKKESEA